MWIGLIKKYSTTILIFVIGILLLLYLKQCNQTKVYKELAKTNSSTIETAAKVVKTYMDNDSNEHTVVLPNIIDQDELNRPTDSSTLSLIDSLSQELKIAKNTITDISRIKSTIQSNTKGTKVDTVYKYNSPNVNWTFNPSNIELDYKANITLNRVDYNDSKKVLGVPFNAKTLYSDIWWDNKDITINSVDRVIVSQKIPQNNFKASAKSEYRFSPQALLTGPSLELNINRFSLEGSYLYNYNEKVWEPTIGLKYHLIK